METGRNWRTEFSEQVESQFSRIDMYYCLYFTSSTTHNKTGKSTSYWRSSQDRIKSQMLVPLHDDSNCCVILPQMVTAGTLTRRAVERTWWTKIGAHVGMP